MDVKELKEKYDQGYVASQDNKEEASNDLVFYYITQWDMLSIDSSDLSYKGQFDMLKSAGRQVISDLAASPIQLDFELKGIAREGAVDLMDGMYREDDNDNGTIESYEIAKQEMIVCGVGAWELYTAYASLRDKDRTQVVKRRPIHEATNIVIWDPNAKMMDKSDATWVSKLSTYTQEGYLDLVEELTGEERSSIDITSFAAPLESYTFPWLLGGTDKVYVVNFYERKKVEDTLVTLADPFGGELTLLGDTLKDSEDQFMDLGYTVKATKDIERWEVTKYIASGAEILSEEVIAGEHLPIVPCYGEYAWVEGEEHYEGIVRTAKDPQRLRNFQMSYLADITSRSPRIKPIYWEEQIQGLEMYHTDGGAEVNFPYALLNRKAPDGEDLPATALGTTPEQSVPQALMTSIELSDNAITKVANAGVPEKIPNREVSPKTVNAVQHRMDMQTFMYQQHFKHAKRRDGQIYASIMAEISDVPREVTIEKPDGTKQSMMIMDHYIDPETGDIVKVNDIYNAEFNVKSRIGPDYGSQKDQTIERLMEMLAIAQPGTPKAEMLQLKILTLMDGVEFEDVRKYANKELVLMGVKEPETEQEAAALKQAQENKPPDPNMVLAQAEMMKGQAQTLEAQVKQILAEVKAQTEGMKQQVDAYNAYTKRYEADIKAKQAQADIGNTNAETVNKQLESATQIIDIRQPQRITDTSDEELFKQLTA